MKKIKMMKKTQGLLVAAVALSGGAFAANLVPDGDFTNVREDLSPLVYNASGPGGKVSLHQEQYTWNKCGKLEVLPTETNRNGFLVYNAVAAIGSEGATRGFPVVGGRIYDFSLELKGTPLQVGIGVHSWSSDYWRDGQQDATSLKFVAVQKDWTLYRGSFKVPDGKTRAALTLQIWESSQYSNPMTVKPGDCVLFDSVKVEASEDGLAALTGGAKRTVAPVARVKTVAFGEKADDFLSFSRQGLGGAVAVAPRFRVTSDGAAFVVDVGLEDASGIVVGDARSPWSGDAVELFFGAAGDATDRERTQFAFNAAGATFAQTEGGKAVGGWEIVRNEVQGNRWTARVRIPFAAIGLGRAARPGETLPFNVAVSRKRGELATWAPVVTGFGDLPHFGRLVCGSYREGLKGNYGADEACADRAAYERRAAELETAARQRELDRFADRAFTVAVLPVDTDYAIPFVPRESFHPVTNIHLKGAVNERIGLPVAILNLRDQDETYVVRLETDTADPAPGRDFAEKQYNGTWGLKGFPETQLVARVALRFKDADTTPVTRRYEMLPKMNEACTVMVPAHEAGIAWFDFDTADVKPGTYRGRLRVIPLGEKSEWKPHRGVAYHHRVYEGQMQDVPVALEVRPIVLARESKRPFGFFQDATTEGQFELMHEIGTREFQTSPWSFDWARTADGRYDYARPAKTVGEAGEGVRKMRAWGKARGFAPTFFIGFSAFDVFRGKCGLKNDFVRALALWPDYLRGVKQCMNAWGVPDADYNIEVYDEPNPKRFDEIRQVMTAAKETLPNVRLTITLGAEIMGADDMKRLDPYVDGWVLYSHGYFRRPDHRAYVADALARGKTVWHYTCGESGRMPIYETYRLHPWFGARHNLTGNQFYIFQAMTGGYGPADFKTAASSGIAYRSFESTMPSLRYMSMRRGVEDLKYLDLLENVAGDRPEVKKFLAEAPVKVVETERHDKTTPDRLREQAAELILQYAKETK